MVMRLFNSLLILTLLLSPVVSLAAQLEAVLDRTRVGLEESFALELRASGSLEGDPDLSVLDKDFELLGRSQSSQVQIVNTDISRTTTWSLSLLARSAGRKTIPAICVEDDCSKPVIIDVLPAGQSSNGAVGESDLLLEVSAVPDKVWVQSQLLYKVRIMTRLNFLQASLSEPEPSGIEAVVQKLGDDRNYETERNGLRYRVIERSYAIFPQQSGPLTIPEIRFGAQIAEPGRRGYDPFNQRTRQIRKRSKAINIEVLPAADAKGRSWLPANNLSLEDDWQQPPQLTVGEPATRTITLRASGLPSAQLPPITVDVPEGVRSYPDQPNREDQLNENGMLGILQQK
ncbi:MAG: protein BatD, partial [Desulfuromonadales bacterium]|nr:protein BatD [Desulfuromonadales bacterium]